MNVIIFESKDLQGLTGDNGERYCVFFKDEANPLNSGWIWVNTLDEAQAIKAKYINPQHEAYNQYLSNLAHEIERERDIF